MSGTSTPHWPALDGLRGIAVIGVVAFHVDRLPGGFLGVDLFFTLSGFLITSLLLREQATTGRIRLGPFWARRFRRLLPAVMLLIGAVLAWLAVWGTPAEQATSRDDARWAIPYLANWHLIASARDYWASATSSSAFTHLWSLAIEEQFYLLWPLAVWAMAGRGRRLLQVTVLTTAASAIAMVVLAARVGDTRAYMGTDTRAAALLLGAIAAFPVVRERVDAWVTSRPRHADATLVTAIGLLGLLWWWGGRDLDVLLRGGLLVHSLLAAVVVSLLVGGTGIGLIGRVGTALSGRRLTWVGTMSYGIYLWHWPLIQLGRPRIDALPDLARDTLLVAVAVVLAAVSFHLVEQPVRRQHSWARGPRATTATAALTAVALLVVVVAPSGRGSVATFDPTSIAGPTTTVGDGPATAAEPEGSPVAPTRPADTSIDRTTDIAIDRTTDTPASAATTGSPNEVVRTTVPPTTSTLPRRSIERVLWIGDSIAADAAPAVVAALSAAGLTVVDGSFAGRRIVSSEAVDAARLYPALLAEHSPDLVVVQLSIWDSARSIDELRIAFTWFRDVVRASGASVMFLPPPPTPPTDDSDGLLRQLAVARDLAVEDPLRTFVLDPSTVWGTEVDTDLDDDRIPDRKWDGVHLCPQGAARLATWLVDELAERFTGVTPAPPLTWLSGDWAADRTYDTPVGACALLSD